METTVFRRTHEIGILFEIEGLAASSYGRAAYRILFENLDPRQFAGCTVWDGDTEATLNSQANQYCIAVRAKRRTVADHVKEVLGDLDHAGLAHPSRRFIEGKVIDAEPVVLCGQTDTAGVFHVWWEDGVIRPDLAEGTPWQVALEFRDPDNRQYA
jgi:hypothetical protein